MVGMMVGGDRNAIAKEDSAALRNILQRVEAANMELAGIEERLDRVLVRAFGGGGSEGAASRENPRAVPSGVVAAVAEQQDMLCARLGSIQSLISRIDAIV